ncbi:hypothetical protein SOM11_14925 [Frigoribacterium sp. CFBP9039]|uniref:hypothetical protein n=1 Tax=unclassified Frigoribacterium TaxID=2627005 RepID=UPI00177FA910|nr:MULTISPECIES: hypothetical protein [unclassified Frigoribacterium]MBD8703932.1 hypothetical protein [Frigoribacterium sp. CFBP 13712]MDY0947286.1 hypothetical protein [Frigoribacterium sp. CFBP9039]
MTTKRRAAQGMRLRRDASGSVEADALVLDATDADADADAGALAEPADAVVPLPAGLARRTIYLLSPVVHGLFGVLAFAGALSVTPDALGPVAGMVARMLYVSSALLSFFLTTMIVAVRVDVRRGGVRPPLSVPLVYALSPVTGGLMLAAAYVSQLNGGPFAGGWGAMLLTTLSLVLLTQRSRTRP